MRKILLATFLLSLSPQLLADNGWYSEITYHDINHNEVGYRINDFDGNIIADIPAEFDHLHGYREPCGFSQES